MENVQRVMANLTPSRMLIEQFLSSKFYCYEHRAYFHWVLKPSKSQKFSFFASRTQSWPCRNTASCLVHFFFFDKSKQIQRDKYWVMIIQKSYKDVLHKLKSFSLIFFKDKKNYFHFHPTVLFNVFCCFDSIRGPNSIINRVVWHQKFRWIPQDDLRAISRVDSYGSK